MILVIPFFVLKSKLIINNFLSPQTAIKEQLEGENNAVKVAKKVRTNLSDDRIQRLHNKYKR